LVDSSDLAIDRINQSVKEGGHLIENNIVKRRYKRCVHNFRNGYIKLPDDWMVFGNSGQVPGKIIERKSNVNE
jgi:predicted ABC-type ATPase